jgi:hypothetical protein
LPGVERAPPVDDLPGKLISARDQEPRLLQARIERAELGGEACALGRDRRILRRRALPGRRPELLELRLELGAARLELCDLDAELLAYGVDGLAEVEQRLDRQGLALERCLEPVEREFCRFELCRSQVREVPRLLRAAQSGARHAEQRDRSERAQPAEPGEWA